MLHPAEDVTCIRFVDQDTLVSVGLSQFICVWALKNWRLSDSASSAASVVMAGCCVVVLAEHDDAVTSLALASGRMYSSSADGSIVSWSTQGFLCNFRMKSSTCITALCCNDHVVCSADPSRILKVWSATNGDCLKEINVGRTIGSLCCSASTLFVSVARHVCVPYNLSTYTVEQQLSLPTPPDDDLTLMSTSVYGSIVTGISGDQAIALTAGGHMEVLHLDRIPVTCLHASAGFVVVSHEDRNAVCVFYIEPFMAELTAQLQLPQPQYFESVRAANSKIASTNRSLNVQVTSTGASRTFSVVSMNGIFYLGQADGCLQSFQRFSSGAAKCLFSCQAHEDAVACSAILQLKVADAIVTGSGDGSVKLWAQSGGQLLAEIEIGFAVSSMCTHQGSVVVGLEDGMLLLIEVDGKNRFKVVGEMRGHVSRVLALTC
jgi:WD40 repeat protein